MSLRKSVRLVDATARLCHEFTDLGDVNWSGSLNSIAAYLKLMLDENMPVLSESEKLAFVAALNGHMPNPNLETELELLPCSISEGYKCDGDITAIIDDSDTDVSEFVARIESWSKSQRLAAIYMARAFWRAGPVVEADDDEDDAE
jgi:hypothetical protein